ncbi:MAG: hypothetical protein BA863_08975 [Desulfovibrio sp. S3730MH75]|nr:MAG: hypothetical protein BA863_08975 [Desulfovibrio sp. S3730MH75]
MKKQFPIDRTTAMCVQLAESKSAPEWIELLPSGDSVLGRDGRHWKHNPQGLLNAFEMDPKPIPVDYEHATEVKGPNGDPAPAVGWIEGLEVRDGGSVWGRVDWTEEGRRAVEAKEYRFISPVFSYSKTTQQILQVCSVGLTNMPNLHLTALNRDETITHENNSEDNVDVVKLCKSLGLAEDSTEEVVLNAIQALKDDIVKAKNKQELPDISKYVPRAEYDSMSGRAVNAEQKIKELTDAEGEVAINREVDAAVVAGKITPASKDYFLASCRAEGGLAAFREFVKGAPEIVSKAGDDKKPAADGDGVLSDEERAACRLTNTSEEDFLKEKGGK